MRNLQKARQSRKELCSTIVAHLSKDGIMFVHPTQNRCLTPREAARIQSFPDWFEFPVARTHQFRIIGNAVPPLVAEAVGLEVREFLGAAKDRVKSDLLLPQSQAQAAARLQDIARLDRRQLRACERPIFLSGWFALFYLFPGLHPDNALDHGDREEKWAPDAPALPGLEDLTTDRFSRSGWPVALELLGHEASRRYDAGQLTEEEFYCADAQRLGLQTPATTWPPKMATSDLLDEPFDHLPPEAESTFEGHRAFGCDLSTALADIVDNAITAKARHVWIEFEWDGPASTITITDDGDGMSEKELIATMRLSSRNPRDERTLAATTAKAAIEGAVAIEGQRPGPIPA